jgi:hypothetical protein
MAGIKDYSTTQADNTTLNSISTAEGMLPSNLNNAIRALMKNTREWYNDSQWVIFGDGSGAYTAAYASATSFTIAGVDVSLIYHEGRRIKLIASTPGTIYGTISSSTFSTNTTVNVTWDSGSLSSEAITNVFVGALSKTNTSIPSDVIGATQLADNAVTTSKIQGDAVNGTKIADDSINSEHYVDGSIDTAHIADSQITTSKLATDAVTTAKITDANVTLAKLASSSVNSAKIVDDSIVNADINSSAAIDATKIADGTVTSTEFQYINTLGSNAQTQLDAKLVKASNLSDVANAGTSRSNLGLGTIATQASDNVSLTGGSITGLGEPSSNSDASTKSYVDQAVAGLRTRIIAECASTANVNLTNGLEAGDAIDGVTLVAGDRVLVKDQSTASENGLYLAVSSGAASRDPEHDSIAELSGGMVVVNQGSTNDNKIFLCTTDNTGSVGSTSITYTVITPSNSGTVTSIATGTGIDGGTITSTGTISIDSTVATLAGTQTLTNKTLTSPKINEDVALTSNSTELNLLDGVSGLVQADFTKLAAIDASAVEINTLDGLSRGSIIYGNSSAATAILTKGGANTVLTSDGTDIAWSDPAGGGTDWQAVKTSTFTAVAGEGYFINTTGGAFEMDLPAGSIGDEISFIDYAGTFDTNALTIDQNGTEKIAGSTDPLTVSIERAANTLVYVDGTQGWLLKNK